MIIALAIFLIGFWIFGKPQRREQFNPYIKAHKLKWKNEKQYKDYLNWLDKKGGDVPLSEIKHPKEIEIINQIKKHI